MLWDDYDSIEEILKDFVREIDPNEVAGFNYGEERSNRERVVNDGTDLPF